MKSYKLKKDLPDISAGTIVTHVSDGRFSIKDGKSEVTISRIGDPMVFGWFMNADELPDWFEPTTIRWRAEKGKPYFYLSNKLVIDTANDEHLEFDNDMFNCGNYFETLNDAEQAAARVWVVLTDIQDEILRSSTKEALETKS